MERCWRSMKQVIVTLVPVDRMHRGVMRTSVVDDSSDDRDDDDDSAKSEIGNVTAHDDDGLMNKRGDDTLHKRCGETFDKDDAAAASSDDDDDDDDDELCQFAIE